jgi:hypothetical protein
LERVALTSNLTLIQGVSVKEKKIGKHT